MSRILALLAKLSWIPAFGRTVYQVAKYIMGHQEDLTAILEQTKELYWLVKRAREQASPGGDTITLSEFQQLLSRTEELCEALKPLLGGLATL